MSESPVPRQSIVRFGQFEFDPSTEELRKAGLRLKLRGQPVRILKALLERPGEVVTREELRQLLWPGRTFVDFDSAMNVAVMKLRQHLMDTAENPRYIETLPRFGYRFVYPLSAQDPEVESSPPPPHRSNLRVPLSIGLGLLLTVWAITAMLRTVGTNAPARTFNLTPLTSLPGAEEAPAVSPDGTLIAFSWTDGENTGIQLMLPDGSGRRSLTAGKLPVQDRNPVWSPDGQWVAFVRWLPTGREAWLISVLGSNARRVTATNGYFVAFHPSGKDLIVPVREPQNDYFRLDRVPLDGGPVSIFSEPGEKPNAYVPFVFSRDGKAFAFVESRPDGGEVSVCERPTLGGSKTVRARRPRMIRGLAYAFNPQDSSPRPLVISNEHHGQARLETILAGPESIQAVDLPTLDNLLSPAVDRAGRLIFERHQHQRELHWRSIDGSAGDRTLAPSTRQDSAPAFSPNGKDVAFLSNRQGPLEIWVVSTSGQESRKLTGVAANNLRIGSLAWSPDGKWIAFDARDRMWQLYRIPSAGGRVELLSSSTEDELRPSYSRDGRWIYFTRKFVERMELWRRRTSSPLSQPERVGNLTGIDARESGNGKWLYYCPDINSGPLLRWSLEKAGGEPEQVIPAGVAHGWWDVVPGGNDILYVRTLEAGPERLRDYEVVRYSPDTSRQRVVSRFRGQLYRSDRDFAVSPDGKSILVAQVELNNIDLLAAESK